MKIFKLSSFILFSVFCMWIVTPQLHAKEHKHKYKIRSSSFALNVNLNPTPVYGVVCPPPRPAPAYVERTTIIRTPYPAYREYIYPPSYYREERIIERPAYVERVYTHPHYSYWGY